MRQSVISELVYRASNSCHIICLILVIAAVGMIHRVALGQCELQTIWSPDGGLDYHFGWAAAGSATMEVIIIGEFGFNNFTGVAHIYRYDGTSWEYEVMLAAPDGPQLGAQFARVVDMSADGKTIIISELLDTSNGLLAAGAVWVYVEEGGKWVVQQKLTASDAEDGWVFGEQLALSDDGNVAAISATGAFGDPVYVFTREGNTWTEVDKLDGDGSFWGLPWVDLSDDGGVLVVGASGDFDQGQGAGAVFIFVRSKDQGLWVFQQKLLASDGVAFDHFGRDPSLSATGDTIITGAVGDDEVGNCSGAAYVFQRKGDMWFEQVKLLASDAQSQHFFGASTKLTPDGQRAIIKASNNAPYVFDFIDGKWVETKRLTSSDPNIVSLGDAIAISDDGSTALLGAPSSKVDGVFWYGAAALFDLEAPLGDLNCDGSISVTDLLELLANWGYCFYWDPEDGCEFFGGCSADLDYDCQVGTSDLLILLANWG